MSKLPLVTIGLPVYNSERYLPQAIESLLSQSFTDFVMIISDNASTDATEEICHSFKAKDSRIRYFRNEENIGNPRNFNRIFHLTETPYLKWSTADDYCEPTFLEKAVPIMESDRSIILCYPKTYIVDEQGDIRKPYEDNLHLMQDDAFTRFTTLIRNIGLSHQHLGLIRVSQARETHLLRTHVGSDINFLAEMALHGKFFEIPERLFYRRFHPTSGSWKRGDREHQAKFYHSTSAPSLGFKHWKTHYAHFASVLSASLSLSEKAKLLAWMTGSSVASRKGLIQDVRDFSRSRSA